MIYRVTFSDGTMCHTGYKPLAIVWAKRKGARIIEISQRHEEKQKMNISFESRDMVIDSDGMQLGTIRPNDTDIEGNEIAWTFEAIADVEFAADELRAIADKLDELNGAKG